MLYKFSIERNKISETAAELYSTGLVADLTIEDPPLKDIIGELFSSVRDSNNAIS
jgi:ABC-type uncharacterized transport system ATPase subunit